MLVIRFRKPVADGQREISKPLLVLLQHVGHAFPFRNIPDICQNMRRDLVLVFHQRGRQCSVDKASVFFSISFYEALSRLMLLAFKGPGMYDFVRPDLRWMSQVRIYQAL